MLISKSDFINLCKSMGKDPEFEKLRAEVLSILKKQAKTEGNEKDIHKSLLEMDRSFKYLNPKSLKISRGYPVETLKSIDGNIYIKSSPSDWELVYTAEEIEKANRGHLVPKQVQVTNAKGKTYMKTVYVNPNQLHGKKKYSQETHGAKVSVGRIIAAVNKCENVEQLMKIVMANKDRFVDANGNHLPIVDKIRAAADRKNEELSSGGSSTEDKLSAAKKNLADATKRKAAIRDKYGVDSKEFETAQKEENDAADKRNELLKKRESEAKERIHSRFGKKESKTSTKASNNTSSAYAPSESADLDSKEVIASNKSIGDGEVEMPYSKELDAEIKSLNNYRSTDETRKMPNSVYYNNGNLVATDGLRMKTIKVGELEGIANGSYVDVTSGKDGVKIKVKEVTDVDGNKVQFPSYDKVIPSENTQKVSLDNNVLKDKLKTMLKDGSIDKKVGRVALEFKDDGVFVDGTKVGNASNIKLKSGGRSNSGIDTNNIFVNANYLLDALTGNESTMMLSDNAGKAMSIGTGSTNNIIMPMNPINDTDPNKLPDYEAGRKAKAESDKFKADSKNALIEGNKKHYEEAVKEIENVSSDKVISNITDLSNDKLASIWDLGNMPIDKLHAVKDWSKNKKLTKVSYNYATILKHHYIMQRPEVRDAFEAEMKKRGLDTSIRKSLFDDLEEDYEEGFGEKSNVNVFQRGDFDEYKISDEELMEHSGSELFESVNIAETVRSVLSEII